MAFLKKSLAEDSVDRYSHTWTFMFFLLLSIICLSLSLSPSVTPIQSMSSYRPDGKNQNETSATMGIIYPSYTASCWCPAEFPKRYIIFANTVCSSKLNSIVQGQRFSGARIYQLPDINDRPQPLQREDYLLQTIPFSGVSENQKDAESLEDNKQNEFTRHEKTFQDLIIYKTPLYLFLLAICLRLPKAIWSILSICCGCINIDQTLETAQNTQPIDSVSQQRIKGEIAMIDGKSLKKSSALLYLLMKLLTVAVLCVEVVVVGHGLLEVSNNLENGSVHLKIQAEDEESVFQDLPDNRIYLCGFNIRQLQNIQTWTVQCLFTLKARTSNVVGHSASRYDESILKQSTDYMTEKRILLTYKALFIIVLATLVILALCNITSLLVWLLKLALSSRQSLGLKADASLDAVFLVTMAWCNTSATVAMDLAKGFMWSDGSRRDKQEEHIKLTDDIDNSESVFSVK